MMWKKYTYISCISYSTTQVAYQYYLTVSPADGRLYVSDPEKHQILRVLSLEPVQDPSINSEPVRINKILFARHMLSWLYFRLLEVGNAVFQETKICAEMKVLPFKRD